MDKKTQKRLLLALMLLTTLPFFFLVDFPSSWSFETRDLRSIAVYLASTFGFVGVSLLLWQFILGTRSVSRHISKDIAWTNKLHRFLGTYGTLLIFAHPILIAKGLDKGNTYSLELGFDTNFETHVSLGRLAIYVLVVVWVSSALLRGKMKYRPWKYLHYIAYVALPLVFIHARDIGFSFDNTLVNVYWNLFIVAFVVLVIARLGFVFGWSKTKGQVLLNKPLNKYVNHLKIKTSKPLTIRPGQFVFIQRGFFSEEHPFTVVDYENDKQEIEIAFKLIGPFTQKLAEVKKGSLLRIDGPFGEFTKEVVGIEEKAVFIAGGIGITPFIKRLREDPKDNILLFANQSSQTAVYREELKRLLGKNYVDVFSNQKAKGKNQESGYVNKELLAKYVSKPKDRDYFICGPKPMMDEVKKALQELGVDRARIYSEEFTF